MLLSEVESFASTDIYYYASRAIKGNGLGSEWGKVMEDVVKYGDVFVKSTQVYTSCDMDYYSIAAGVSFQSVSGFSNFAINSLWRILDSDELYTMFEAGILTKDYALVGTSMGTFTKLLFATEIPDVSLDQAYEFTQ